MSSTFEVAYGTLHDHEKGVVSEEKARRIHDAGGVTKDGVSLRLLREMRFDVDGDGDIDAADVMALTPEQIKYDVMEHVFWHPKYDQLNDQRVATKMLDMAVNMGSFQAHKLAQQAANVCGASLNVDGDFGTKTLRAVNALAPDTFLAAACQEQADFYNHILQRKPGMAPCRVGWLDRADWPFNDGRFLV